MPEFFKKIFTEEGNANAEMVILLPVYIIITYAMFFFGEMGLAQQAAEKAARYAAWKPDNAQRAQIFFKVYSFPKQSLSSPSANAKEVAMFTQQDISDALGKAGFNPTGANGADLKSPIASFLNGIEKACFKRSEANIKFSFGPRGLNFIPNVNIRAYHAVDLPTGYERKANLKGASESGPHHSIEEMAGILGN